MSRTVPASGESLGRQRGAARRAARANRRRDAGSGPAPGGRDQGLFTPSPQPLDVVRRQRFAKAPGSAGSGWDCIWPSRSPWPTVGRLRSPRGRGQARRSACRFRPPGANSSRRRHSPGRPIRLALRRRDARGGVSTTCTVAAYLTGGREGEVERDGEIAHQERLEDHARRGLGGELRRTARKRRIPPVPEPTRRAPVRGAPPPPRSYPARRG